MVVILRIMILDTSVTRDEIIELTCLNDLYQVDNYTPSDKLITVVKRLFSSRSISLIYICCDEQIISGINHCMTKEVDKLLYINDKSTTIDKLLKEYIDSDIKINHPIHVIN